MDASDLFVRFLHCSSCTRTSIGGVNVCCCCLVMGLSSQGSTGARSLDDTTISPLVWKVSARRKKFVHPSILCPRRQDLKRHRTQSAWSPGPLQSDTRCGSMRAACLSTVESSWATAALRGQRDDTLALESCKQSHHLAR